MTLLPINRRARDELSSTRGGDSSVDAGGVLARVIGGALTREEVQGLVIQMGAWHQVFVGLEKESCKMDNPTYIARGGNSSWPLCLSSVKFSQANIYSPD